MIELLTRIGERLQSSAYVNEAAVSHGVVIPILGELGWDTADPRQVVPEYRNARGRVDFALLGRGQKPAIFVEVKQVGLAPTGDRQLFEYAYHEGVPLCVLTDGLEWSFYLPGGQGSYDDRRVYRLQLDDRPPEESRAILARYLQRESVLDRSAFENARLDYDAVSGQREALSVLPRAWAELVQEAHEMLLETLVDKVEALSGYAPAQDDALAFLQCLRPAELASASRRRTIRSQAPARTLDETQPVQNGDLKTGDANLKAPRLAVSYSLFGQARTSPNASVALTEILREIAKRNPAKLAELGDAVRSPKRNHVSQALKDIYPGRPELARAAEIAPGWWVGLNIANRDKMMILRTACEVYGLSMPADLEIILPNA